MPINSFLYPGAKFTPGYEVANSCRFDKAGTAYMHKSQGTPSSRRTFTYSGWVKFGLLNTYQIIFESADGSHNFQIVKQPDGDNNDLRIYDYDGSTNLDLRTSQHFVDHSAWYHICVAIDTTQGSASNRAKLYINGTQVTAFDTATYPDQNYDTAFVANKNIQVGRQQSTSYYFDGYMAEVCFIDGSALTPSSFGEFDEDSPRIWKPKDVSGLTFGNNGFYLDFEDSGNLGNDANGGTDLTEVNLAAADQATDTPTNNFCTLNCFQYPLSTLGTFTEGNCIVVTGGGSSSSAGYSHFIGTFGLSAGKWYWEAKCTDTGAASLIGIVDKPADVANASLNSYTYGYAYRHSDGDIYNNGSGADYGNTYGTSDIIGVALDLDNNKLYFSKGGTWQNSGDPTSGATGTGAKSITAAASTNTGFYFPVVGDTDYADTSTFQLNFGGCPAFSISSGNADANGYGNFEYAVPSGYLSLCSKNLGSDGG